MATLTENALEVSKEILNAGAVFIHTPEPIGDYIAGPSHTLPTGGGARFFSPLSSLFFLKCTSVIAYTPEKLQEEAQKAITLAEAEKLLGHAESLRKRLKE